MTKTTATYTAAAARLRQGVRLHAARTHRFQVRPHGLTLLEMDDVLFSTNSAVMMPFRLDEETGRIVTDDEGGMRPQGIGLLYALLQYLRDRQDEGLHLLIAGHTDTTGNARHNEGLSIARAQCVYFLLMGWDWRVEWGHLMDDWHQVADVQRLLKYLAWRIGGNEDLDPGPVDNAYGSNTRHAVRSFQELYNPAKDRLGFGASPTISVDGALGPKTWSALFDVIYLRELAYMLGCPPVGPLIEEWRTAIRWADTEWPCKGFGESFPVDEKHRDNYRSESNRRVELVLFPEQDCPTLPDYPNQGSTYTIDECPFYDTSAYERAYLDPELVFNNSLEVQAVSEAGEPVANVQLLIEPDLTQEPVPMECDADGYGCLKGELPPGNVRILHGETAETGRVRRGNDLVPAVLRTRRELGVAGIPEVVVTFLPDEEREERRWIQERYGPPVPSPDQPQGTVITDPDDIEITPADGEVGEDADAAASDEPSDPQGPVAYDNLALAARADGTDPNHERLFDTVKQWLHDYHAVVQEHGFFLIVYDAGYVRCFNPAGAIAVKAPLKAPVQGYFGAFAAFFAPENPMLLDMASRTRGLEGDFEDVNEDGRINAIDMVAEPSAGDRIQAFVNRYSDRFQITYHAPTEDQVGAVALRGGSGLLEPYIDHVREHIHERNKKTIRSVVSAHADATRQYIAEVERITEPEEVSILDEITKDGFGFGDAAGVSDERKAELEAAEAEKRREVKRKTLALKQLGPPPQLYTFRRPQGIENPEWDELLKEMGSYWEYRAWKAVSDGINAINERHSQGMPYLRLKVKPKADMRTLRKFVGDTPVEAGPYARWEVETTIDIGSNGTFVQRDPVHVVGVDAGVSKGGGSDKQNVVNASMEVERNQATGEEKTKWNVGIKDYGFEVADDGSVKITGGVGVVDVVGEHNYLTKETGHGIVLDTEFGEVYVGIHFMGLTEENIVAYLSRAPGFFERSAVYEYFEPDLMWRDLTSNERVHMATFGWTQISWDDRSRTPFREFPDPVYSDPTQANSGLEKFLSLSPAQKRAAARLGIQRHDWSEWKLAAQPE